MSHLAQDIGCKVQCCGGRTFARGLCQKHYARLLRHGSPTGGAPEYGVPLQWLVDHKNHSGSECLTWPFSTWGGDKGRIIFRGRKTIAARAMCIISHGDPPEDDMEAAHSCGNGHKACVNQNHLRWATQEENEADKKLHGTHVKGSRVQGSKLSVEMVRAIRQDLLSLPRLEIAKNYGVDRTSVRNIANGKTWRWLQ